MDLVKLMVPSLQQRLASSELNKKLVLVGAFFLFPQSLCLCAAQGLAHAMLVCLPKRCVQGAPSPWFSEHLHAPLFRLVPWGCHRPCPTTKPLL